MTDPVAQAVNALIAAIDTSRRNLPRGDYAAARDLSQQCEAARRLLHEACKRVERRCQPRPRPVGPVAPKGDPLARQIIDTGYKALAAELHPDKGGLHDDMARLNEVRERLRRGA